MERFSIAVTVTGTGANGPERKATYMNRASSGCRINLLNHFAMQLAFLDECAQALAITGDQCLHHALNRRVFGPLKFAKQYPWDPRVPGYEINKKNGIEYIELPVYTMVLR